MLPPCLGSCKQWCNEQWSACVLLNYVFFRIYGQKWDCWIICQFSSLSFVWLFAIPWTAAHQASCLSPIPGACSDSYFKSVMPSNYLILCHPLLLSSVFPSIRVFSNESVLRIRWPRYWSFSFNISPSNEHPGLIKDGLVGSPCSPRDSRVFSNTTVQKHQFFGALYSPTLTSIYDYWKNHRFDYTDLRWQNDISAF